MVADGAAVDVVAVEWVVVLDAGFVGAGAVAVVAAFDEELVTIGSPLVILSSS